MNTRILYPTLFALLACLSLSPLHAQFDEGFVENMSFDEKMRHIRGILIEGDERANLARSHKKTDQALEGFLNTEFMTKYKEIKLEAEVLAATFKAHAPKISPDEVSRVRRAYSTIADKFNMQLLEIKNDLMDKKTQKLIRSHPEMYSNSLQYKLSELKDDYSQNFEKVVAEVTGSDSYSAVPLFAIFSLIKLAVDFTNYLAAANFEARQIKEEMLYSRLIEPYSFRRWEDLIITEGDIYNQAMNPQYEEPVADDPFDPNNPFEEENGTSSSKPKRKKN